MIAAITTVLYLNTLFILYFIGKELLRKFFEVLYQKSLVHKNKTASIIIGRIYYWTINKSILISNGIKDIRAIIYKDLRSFGIISIS